MSKVKSQKYSRISDSLFDNYMIEFVPHFQHRYLSYFMTRQLSSKILPSSM